ncbi:MAG: transglycosylase domain-containing protein, partial [Kiloniellales bacterium]
MAGKRERGGTTRRRARGAGARAAKGRRARSTGRRLLSWFAAATIWGGLALVGLVGWYAYDLPALSIEPPTRQPSITLIAADGSRFASFGPVYGKAVRLGALPSYLPKAVMAVEDRRFYSHPGVDPLGVLRAIYVNIEAGRIVQGGSTITQQLAKNLFLSPDRTLKRKVQELLLAFWLEWHFTKDQILTLYLNRVYLGAGTHGVDAASWHYFNKPAREVSLYEAAMLAGLLKA